MKTSRRTAFALPFVAVTACRPPAPSVPREEEEEADHDDYDESHGGGAEREREPRPPPAVARPDAAPARPDLSALHIDTLPPLESEADYQAKCAAGTYHHCPNPRSEWRRPESATASITWIAPDHAGSRIRFAIPHPRFAAHAWTATLDDQPCAIIAVGGYEAECAVAIAPDAIVHAVVLVEPDPAYVAEFERIACGDPNSGWRCNPPRPPPPPDAAPAPQWVRARILMQTIQSTGTLLVLNVGANQGVTATTEVRLLGVPGATFTIVDVRPRDCRVRTNLTPDQLSAHENRGEATYFVSFRYSLMWRMAARESPL